MLFGAAWYVSCLVKVRRIRKGEKGRGWKDGKRAIMGLSYSGFLIPGLLFVGLIIAVSMGAPLDQALIGIIPSGIWIIWGACVVIRMRKSEICIEDFRKKDIERGREEGERASRIFSFVTPSFALKYAYYPGLLGGFAGYLVLAGFRGALTCSFPLQGQTPRASSGPFLASSSTSGR